MPFPSHILAAGSSPLLAQTVVGSGATGLVATGTTVTDALQLSNSWNAVTTSSASTGVKLPPTEQGATVGIRNDSGQTINVFPPVGSTINAAASSVTLATAKTMLCFATSATTWASITSA